MDFSERGIQEVLTELIGKIVQTVHPRKIMLFGSVAKGRMTRDSDIDLLVIMPDGVHRRKTTKQIYRALFRLNVPKDVMVVTEEDVRRFGNEPSLVLYPALREGKEVYSAG